MRIPTDEQLIEMQPIELERLRAKAYQQRLALNRNNRFQKAQQYSDLIFKLNQLLQHAD